MKPFLTTGEAAKLLDAPNGKSVESLTNLTANFHGLGCIG